MRTANVKINVHFKLAWYARWVLYVATLIGLYVHPAFVPRRFVMWLCCRSWSMRTGSGPWVPIRVDAAGRIV